MRVFEHNSKINFVDNNDVYVGFDAGQYCCENWGYFFSETVPDKIPTELVTTHPNLEFYLFDTTFFSQYGADYNAKATFKLYDAFDNILYLTLFNSHNGYYSHGFTVNVGGEVFNKGRI